jgi:hypothetical protein
MPQPIAQSITNHDLSSRFQGTSTVVASPVDNAETIIASLTLANFGDIPLVSGIRLQGFAAFTIGTSGVSGNLKIRETNASGTTVVASGAVNAGVWAATQLTTLGVLGFDAAPGVATYVMTLTIASGAAASTVSALHLSATLV